MGEEAAVGGNNWLSDLKGLLAPIVAFLVLLGFTAFVIHMLGQVTADEAQWTRALYLFAGVESIAFAAAGFFFGSEIRRQQAESAQQQADEARDKADAARHESGAAERLFTEADVKGRTLAAAVRAETATLRKGVESLKGLPTERALETVEADLEMLQTLADELFPPGD